MSVKMRAVITPDGEGGIHGELNCVYFEEPFVFTSLIRMIEMMETTFDTKGFPEKHMLPRTFGKAKQRFRKHELDLSNHLKENTTVLSRSKSGDNTCSFDISVRFRHHAEWQGHILWLEKDVTKRFSSVVELIKLIDSALADG